MSQPDGMIAPPPQPDNPTDEQRHALERYALLQKGRPEDFEAIRTLLAPPLDISGTVPPGGAKGLRIGVIGGGLAGLAAAFELRKTGADITLFEASERIGGRVYTYYFDEEKHLHGELGAMRIPVSHECTWHYINLLGLNTVPFVQNNENAFIYLKKTRVRNDSRGENMRRYIYPKYFLTEQERRTPWQDLVYEAIDAPLLPAPPAERAELLQVKPSYSAFPTYWDSRSNRNIMQAQGLSQAAISIVSSMSPLAGQNLYNSYVDIAQAQYPANLSFLYQIPGGTSELPRALAESLSSSAPRGYPGIPADALGHVDVRLQSPIFGIRRDESGRVVLVTETGSETFDYVVCAIPFSTLRTVCVDPLFSGLKMQAIREVTYIPSQKTLLLCRRRFWEEGGPDEQIIGGGSYTDLPITSIWYPSDHAGLCDGEVSCRPRGEPYHRLKLREGGGGAAGEPGVLIASYNYGLDTVRLANLTPELRLREIERELEAVHGLPPGYLEGIVEEMVTQNWNNEVWTRGALPFYSPEQKRLFSCGMALPEYDNRVFMAGDHISAVHRWMQGALRSGMQAAGALAQELCRGG